jgi:hypothetical protein
MCAPLEVRQERPEWIDLGSKRPGHVQEEKIEGEVKRILLDLALYVRGAD